MGGLKRKIPTDKKIEKKESKSVAFSKRRKGLFSKTAQLCVLSGAQVAILATPPCSKSNVSFYSFGHSSVDSVVSAFLKNEYPREDHLGSEFWWEDKRLSESEDPKELSEAVDSISRMMQNLKGLRSKALSAGASSSCIHEDPPQNIKEEDQIVEDNKDVVINATHQELDGNQTLGLQSSLASLCIQDVSRENVEGFVNNSEHKNEIVTSSDSNNNNNGLLGSVDGFDQALNLDDDFFDFEMNSEGFITTNLEMNVDSTKGYSCAGSGSEDGAMVVIPSNSIEDNQMVAVSDSTNALPGNLYGCYQEFDIDQIFDFVESTEDLSMNSEMDVASMIASLIEN
ncbi:PREDICTED: agamous-like MADS-box protein AGL97 [Brassica oleracea var. oleracea]|uniref:agamous-like MADS-box protein AGL97 n=1 Tax=Brassica oleracea var. oleracea TaxID=109376 RepID=UPI0006A6BB95|nr:PREDICTED: agamous-like MADS-box protein AGL97 [Brassica oleracea var. oleracea]